MYNIFLKECLIILVSLLKMALVTLMVSLKKPILVYLAEKLKKIGKIELNSSKVYDATDKIVLPGIIDTQVHFREPGSTDAEDLESGSRAAVLGGVTSLFEMPNTNPPTANLIEFDKKLKAAKNRMHSNYAFILEQHQTIRISSQI